MQTRLYTLQAIKSDVQRALKALHGIDITGPITDEELDALDDVYGALDSAWSLCDGMHFQAVVDAERARSLATEEKVE